MVQPVEKLVLHIGVPKTGSTSIQATMVKHSSALREKGWLYPTFQKNHVFLVSAFKENPENLGFNRLAGRTGSQIEQHDRKRLAALIRQIEQSKCSMVLLSSEHLNLLTEKEIVNLKEYLCGLAKSVEIVAYARDPAFQAPSLVQEQVKNGARRIAQCFENPPVFQYRKILGRWVRQFSRDNVTVIPFPGDGLKKGNVVESFSRHIGIWDDAAPMETVRTKESLSGAAVMIADALTEIAPKYSRKRYFKKGLHRITGPKFSLPDEINRRVLELAKPELRYLEREHGIRFPSIEPDSAPFDPRTYCSNETLASIAACLNELAAPSQS